jgi:hypothetical protein
MVNKLVEGLPLPVAEELKRFVETMMERKRRYFPDNKRVILEYHISETREGYYLTVASTLQSHS